LNLLIPQTAVAGHLTSARDCFHRLLDGELFISNVVDHMPAA
jgi:hypothetical protein